MDSSSFDKLTLQEKGVYLKKNGDFITTVEFHSFILQLYRAEGSLFEVWLSALKDKVEKVEVIRDKNNLPSYLKKVDLKGWI